MGDENSQGACLAGERGRTGGDFVIWIGQLVPPLYSNDTALFDPKKNLAFSYCDIRLFIAYRNGRLDGRVAGIINRRANSFRAENMARFGFLEKGMDRRYPRLSSEIDQGARKQ